MKKHALLIAGGLSLILSLTASIAIARPIYPNSVVSNDLEFIKTSDESAFACIKYNGRRTAEMPDKRSDQLMVDRTFIFTAHYSDGTKVGLWAHPDFRLRRARSSQCGQPPKLWASYQPLCAERWIMW